MQITLPILNYISDFFKKPQEQIKSKKRKEKESIIKKVEKPIEKRHIDILI